MSWRVVHITDVDKMALSLDNLKVKKGDKEVKIPLNEIFSVVIEDLTCKVTGRLLVELSKNNILLLVCNQQHLPEMTMLPIQGHCTQYKRIKEQISWDEERKQFMWKRIIKQKIYNQIMVMQKLHVDQDRINKLNDLLAETELFDPSTCEAQAARIYFNSFFEDGFRRRDTDRVENAALNYGYAIINAALTRTIAAKGLIPSLGIHHIGERNAFNLSSDMIEAFRPLVDYYILKEPPEDYLTKTYRLNLINLLHAEVSIDGRQQTVIRAIEIFVSSFVDFFKTGDESVLKMPNMKKIAYHEL
ncbi:type II CRISPR-associated endonuclease Cas1 [Salimicrobium sp. PL1-032A]|uniref:type II CRISPR-associated endonuclease Cas1 n=1 Tax=Salimicrobium sp. PL1-032A TaxID=3095364 RepID=UPI003260FEB6